MTFPTPAAYTKTQVNEILKNEQDRILDRLLTLATKLKLREDRLEFISNGIGVEARGGVDALCTAMSTVADDPARDAGYWAGRVRDMVEAARFIQDSVQVN